MTYVEAHEHRDLATGRTIQHRHTLAGVERTHGHLDAGLARTIDFTSDLDERIAEIEAMGEAPTMFDWSNAARLIFPDLVRVYRAARAFIEVWDGDEDEAGAVRDIRLALNAPQRNAE